MNFCSSTSAFSKVFKGNNMISLNLMGCMTLFLTCKVCLSMFPKSPYNPNEQWTSYKVWKTKNHIFCINIWNLIFKYFRIELHKNNFICHPCYSHLLFNIVSDFLSPNMKDILLITYLTNKMIVGWDVSYDICATSSKQSSY